MVSYSQRRHIFEKEAWQWTLDDDRLIERAPSGQSRRLFLKNVVCVRIAFAPTRYKSNRHTFAIVWKNGSRVEMENYTTKSFANFEDQSKIYTPFVKEVIKCIAEYSPDAILHMGVTPFRYALSIAVMVLSMLVLASVILLIPITPGIWPVTVIIKLALMVLAIPTIFRWAIRSRPNQTSIQFMPPGALP